MLDPLNAARAPIIAMRTATRLSLEPQLSLTYITLAHIDILSAPYTAIADYRTMSSKDAPKASDEITGQSALPSE